MIKEQIKKAYNDSELNKKVWMKLKPNERYILINRFLSSETLTLSKLAKQFKKSRVWVRRLETVSIMKVINKLNE
jgi:DNA-directed RNA polymerase sigma subunit (sigma70/sigma32)